MVPLPPMGKAEKPSRSEKVAAKPTDEAGAIKRFDWSTDLGSSSTASGPPSPNGEGREDKTEKRHGL